MPKQFIAIMRNSIKLSGKFIYLSFYAVKIEEERANMTTS